METLLRDYRTIISFMQALTEATLAPSLLETIRNEVIGEGYPIHTPFGEKPLVYADYTASGRSLAMIENFIRQQVLPYYANTHSETSFTGCQTGLLREQARQEIHRAVNAGSQDRVIFCGSGATAAIQKLIDIMGLRLPQRHQRPVVFIGPYEHHSNELLWRESMAEVVVIPLDSEGLLDIKALAVKLQQYYQHPLKLGCFSAASNVTGLKTDVAAIAHLLHHHNALSCWDYAAAGPYMPIDMSGPIDAVFLSPHKFVGGPGTPGVLVVKQHLLRNRVPTVPGGGTVIFVSPDTHDYSNDPEHREEGGTPGIIESIRAGLVFKLKQSVGTTTIEHCEQGFFRRALARWKNCKAIEILGNTEAPRLAIVSLRIKWQDKDLHYGFVVALLNDLFGIQARGGCSCAGPYAHALLGLDAVYSQALQQQLLQGHTILRPGWVRINFNYFIDEETFNYLVRAIELVAEHGWRMLPYYQYQPSDGVWRYQGTHTVPMTKLDDLDFTETNTTYPTTINNKPLAGYLAQAEQELCRSMRGGTTYSLALPTAVEKLRWFALPQDVLP